MRLYLKSSRLTERELWGSLLKTLAARRSLAIGNGLDPLSQVSLATRWTQLDKSTPPPPLCIPDPGSFNNPLEQPDLSYNCAALRWKRDRISYDGPKAKALSRTESASWKFLAGVMELWHAVG